MGLGAAHLGGMYNRVDGTLAQATLTAAWDNGIRYFDTAPFYGRGLSEHRLGSFLIDRPRSEFVVTTKVGRVLHRPADPEHFDRAPWDGGLNFEIEFTYSYEGVMRAYEQSLMRLGLDTVDALMIHDPEAVKDDAAMMRDLVEGAGRALAELRRSGDIKAYGMGLNAAASLTDIAPRLDIDFAIVAMPYTLLDQSALNAGLQRCTDENIGIIIGAPYASGILATGPGPDARYRYRSAPEDIQERVRRIQAICVAHGIDLPAAALQFPLAHPAVVSIIPGSARPQEVTANIAYLTQPIPASFWADLKTEGLIDAAAPVPREELDDNG